MRTLEYYFNGLVSFAEKLVKKLTVYDIGVTKLICFTIGLIFASWFPNFTKKIKFICFFFSIIMVIPVIAKMYKVFRQVFDY